MTDIIQRIEWEPEIFTLVDGRFLQVNGRSVMVFPIYARRWNLIIRGGGGDIVGYHELSWLQNRRAIRAIRKVRAV